MTGDATDPSATLPNDVVTWIEEITRAPVTALTRVPGGARRQAWHVDTDVAGGDGTLFLRYDPSDPAITGEPWTLQREGQVYVALRDTAVPVPRVLGVHPRHQAFLAERVEGENWFSRLRDPAEQVAVAEDFIDHLAALHRIDPAQLDLAGFPPPTTIPTLVEHELDELEGVLDVRGGDVDPGLRISLDWLRANIPSHAAPIVLVQGDTGPGNFMFAGGRVVAVVDWELAHLGDPMDDIAWLCLRAAQEPLPDLPALLRRYERASGHTIDTHRVRYYRVMAEAKLLVMAHGTELVGDLGNRLIYGALHERLWLEAIVDALGLDPAPPDPLPAPRGPDEATELFDEVLAQLREIVVPAIADPLAGIRAKGLARVVKYLAAVHRAGPFHDTAELDDVAALVGTRPSSSMLARAAADDAMRAGRLTAEQYLGYRWRRALRHDELMRDASGALADRHWPALT